MFCASCLPWSYWRLTLNSIKYVNLNKYLLLYLIWFVTQIELCGCIHLLFHVLFCYSFHAHLFHYIKMISFTLHHCEIAVNHSLMFALSHLFSPLWFYNFISQYNRRNNIQATKYRETNKFVYESSLWALLGTLVSQTTIKSNKSIESWI